MSAPATTAPVVLFDVNETLTDTSALGAVFAEVGAPEHLAATWFAAVLRDGFALTAVGAPATFAVVGAAVARTVLAGSVAPDRLEDAAARVVAAVGELPLHPDVPQGVRALAEQGVRLFTLTNGSVSTSRRLLARAGLDGAFEQLLSVEDGSGGGPWKPAPSAYARACAAAGVAASQALLVAVHPWDVDGASRAGLRTAWVNRSALPHPGVFTAPDLVVADLEELAARLRPA